MKNPLLSCPYLVKKTTILSKLHFIFYYGSKKSIRYPFFSDFSRKISALIPIYCQENVLSLKNKMLSFPYSVRKCQFSQNTMFSSPFFQYNNEKPPAVMPIFGQKTSNLSKTHSIMGQKSQLEK